MLYVMPTIGNYGRVNFNNSVVPPEYGSFVSDIETNGWLFLKGRYSTQHSITGESHLATTVDNAVAVAYYFNGNSVRNICGIKKSCFLYSYLNRYSDYKTGETSTLSPINTPVVSTYEYDNASAFTEAGNLPFNSYDEAYNAIKNWLGVPYPITYNPINCSFPGAPTEAIVGDTVVVPVVFPDGYGLVNESNIYVTNNGVAFPSTYSNGQLTFTMPDPT